jgi:putative NADH-flavin reductase
MKILIFGASGKTGRELVKQALELGYRVTAFVRKPAKLNISNGNLVKFEGNIVNYELVERAVKGQDAVLSALGASNPFLYDPVVVEGMGNIITAMEKLGVDRLIYMSAINVRASRKNAGIIIRALAPLLLRTETEGHEAREKFVRHSLLTWTIVRSASLSNGEHKQQYRFGLNIKTSGIAARISRADVADFMLAQLHDKTFHRKAPMVMY